MNNTNTEVRARQIIEDAMKTLPKEEHSDMLNYFPDDAFEKKPTHRVDFFYTNGGHTSSPATFSSDKEAVNAAIQEAQFRNNICGGVFFIFDVCCTPTLSCRGRRYPVSATPTRTLSVCVNSLDDPRGRGEHCSPAKYHKVTFLLSYFCVTKSQQGGLAPSSFRTTGGVHELAARAMRGECVRQMIT